MSLCKIIFLRGVQMTKKSIPESNIEIIYKAIQDCIAKKITQEQCALCLGISVRQVKRKCKLVRETNNIKSLIHKNKGRLPKNRIANNVRDHVIHCCNNMFKGYGPTLVSYEYQRMYGTNLSVETTRQIMLNGETWVAKEKKSKRIHNMRERMACYGELIQADGTEYDWLGDGNKSVLLIFVDDATSSLLHAVIVKSESTASYMQALHDYMIKHGRPMCLYTDKHGVFRINMPGVPEGSQTQFARAMEELGIKTMQANSPQAKGRVERANRTLQDRLAKRLKLLGVKAIEEANEYIQNIFIAEYNQLFAVEPDSLINMHKPLNKDHNLEQILALHEIRVISKNHTLQYDNQVVQIMNELSNLHKKQAVVIVKKGAIAYVLVNNKAVNFKVLRIRPKQGDVICAKMIGKEVRSVKNAILQHQAIN